MKKSISSLIRSEPQLKNWHPHSKAELNKMTSKQKTNLIIGLENFLLSIMFGYYSRLKAKLPRLRTTKQKALPFRKTKRKKLTGAAKAKFLARMNKGRRKKGLKPIRGK